MKFVITPSGRRAGSPDPAGIYASRWFRARTWQAMSLLLIALPLFAANFPPLQRGDKRGASLVSDPVTSRPTFLLVNGVDRHHGRVAVSPERAKAIAEDFLAANGSEFGIQNLDELAVDTVRRDELGFTHVHFAQVYEGLPVRCGEMIVHLNARGEVYAMNGKFAAEIKVGISPGITAETAAALARNQMVADFRLNNTPEAKNIKLVILPLGILNNTKDDDVHLAWEMMVETEENHGESATYFVDAQTGKVLNYIDSSRRLTRRLLDCSNSVNWPCPYETYDSTYNYTFGRREGRPDRGPNPLPDPRFNGKLDVDVTYNSLLPTVTNYWITTFNRNGANNQGGYGGGSTGHGAAVAAVNALADNTWPSGCPLNARFHGAWAEIDLCAGMAYVGNDPAQIRWDVMGHEYAHGVVWFSIPPSGTIYSGEAGSMEESFCDVMGDAIEQYASGQHDWLFMADLIWARNLVDPPSIIDPDRGGPYPDRVRSSTVYCGNEDTGGVHHNSTIHSKACYLMSEGGQFNGCFIQGIGFDAVQRILYRAWTTYYTSTVTFADAYVGMQQACTDLYPDSLASVTAALQAVEMDQAGLCSGIAEVAPACAVHSAGTVTCDTVAYAGSTLRVQGTGGYAGRVATLYLRAHQDSTGIWSAITDTIHTTAIIEQDGSFSASLTPADTGHFDILADENSDGFYQPWADTILTVHVVTGAVQHLVAQYVEPDRIALCWQPLSGATHYAVESDSSMAFGFPSVIATVADTVFVDSVNVGTHLRMFYRVRAVSE